MDYTGAGEAGVCVGAGVIDGAYVRLGTCHSAVKGSEGDHGGVDFGVGVDVIAGVDVTDCVSTGVEALFRSY